MPQYTFSMHNTGTVTEKLGSRVSDDDAAALTFGRDVIRDFLREDGGKYFNWILDISDDDRAVGTIPFKSQLN
jgi:hypothetical protein